MKEKDKIYTAAEIVRYHSGAMSVEEMHALEKASLEDPFLADAVEGYAQATNFENNIEELKTSLAKKRKKKNLYFITSLSQNKWWRIAAVLIVLAGAGYFFYRANYNNRDMLIARNETKTLRKNSNSVINKDTANYTDNTLVQTDHTVTNQNSPKSVPQIKSLPQRKLPREKDIAVAVPKTPSGIIRKNANRSGDLVTDSIQLDLAKKNNSAADTAYVLAGRVIDEIGDPIPYATISDNKNNHIVRADESGKFSFKSSDSSMTAIASAAGFYPKTIGLKKDIQSEVAINRNENQLTEIVVTAVTPRKKAKVKEYNSKNLQGRISGVNIDQGNVFPSDGFNSFGNYLKEKTPPVYNENGERLTGEVSLSFTVDKKGNPENITVIKSSCSACEKEAIKLLQSGPKWRSENDNDKHGTVILRF